MLIWRDENQAETKDWTVRDREEEDAAKQINLFILPAPTERGERRVRHLIRHVIIVWSGRGMSSCKLTGTLLSAVQPCHQLIGLPDQLGWSSQLSLSSSDDRHLWGPDESVARLVLQDHLYFYVYLVSLSADIQLLQSHTRFELDNERMWWMSDPVIIWTK